ncbi:uncharacterized protein LOC127257370 [Andrographis paniculata]|uniref:uncharacterized protein LOC127257370 n=1 Tax=Andrographis paniculata TaxID=175694 RepID=UPI0021E6F4AA|nr:uncharacterized protein LOC127257370 [Andrographis paniculata]
MGSLYDILDITESFMARKAAAHKRHGSGLEAPRNSLELPMEKCYGFYAARDNILYGHHIAKESSAPDRYSMEVPLKKLISDDLSKRPDPPLNAPSVVARLMGVDTLPVDSKSTQRQVYEKTDKIPTRKSMDKPESKKDSVGHTRSFTDWSLQSDIDSFGQYDDMYYPKQFSSRTKPSKPKRREHPQEEELQKFKKEFEAWQAARFNVCSNVGKFACDPAQFIAQEDLNREKMFLNTRKIANEERPWENYGELSSVEMLALESCKKKVLCNSAEWKESLHASRASRPEFLASRLASCNEKFDVVSAPTKIVVLRPGPDRMHINEDSYNNTPSASEDRVDIEDFLKEVKERLKSELQGKTSKKSTTARGGGIETPYREKPSEPKRIAQRIAQEVRDSVSRDLELNLPRSESTRSYRSESHLNGSDSPEFINRDTRRYLAERLRNVLKGETHGEAPTVVRNRSRLSMPDHDKGGAVQSRVAWCDGSIGFSESFATELEKQSRSFRGEPDEAGMQQRDLSPRNLIRSLSAPVSGTSFGKLLLEDRHVLTGAHIRRKHEVIEKISVNIKKPKKDKFNIKEKVSSFRYSLTLRGRLFRRRVKSVDGLDPDRNYPFKDLATGPTVMTSFCEANENSTEVPPSPASVCSSIHEEFWRPTDYLSPISSTGANHLEDSEMSHVFREINSNLIELRRKLNQFESSVQDEAVSEQKPAAPKEVVVEDEVEAYIRDLLIASGLYGGSFIRSMTKWDPLGKPISAEAFEEVEATYGQSAKTDEFCSRKDHEDRGDRKMILDLLNEVLPATLREPVKTSKYLEKVIGSVHKPPYGRMLLSRVWDIAREYIHPPADRSCYTLDYMLARDLKSEPWSQVVDDDVSGLGRDIECWIIEDVIEEMVEDMQM